MSQECKNYLLKGMCPYGARCRYTHNYNLASLPRLSRQLDLMITLINDLEDKLIKDPNKKKGEKRDSSRNRLNQSLRGHASSGSTRPSSPSCSGGRKSRSRRQSNARQDMGTRSSSEPSERATMGAVFQKLGTLHDQLEGSTEQQVPLGKGKQPKTTKAPKKQTANVNKKATTPPYAQPNLADMVKTEYSPDAVPVVTTHNISSVPDNIPTVEVDVQEEEIINPHPENNQ